MGLMVYPLNQEKLCTGNWLLEKKHSIEKWQLEKNCSLKTGCPKDDAQTITFHLADFWCTTLPSSGQGPAPALAGLSRALFPIPPTHPPSHPPGKVYFWALSQPGSWWLLDLAYWG